MPFKDDPVNVRNMNIWEVKFLVKSYYDGNEYLSRNKKVPIPDEKYFYIWNTSKNNIQLIPASKPNHKFRFSIPKNQIKFSFVLKEYIYLFKVTMMKELDKRGSKVFGEGATMQLSFTLMEIFAAINNDVICTKYTVGEI